MLEATRERFYAKTEPEPTSGCLIWIGGRAIGYGMFSYLGLSIKAHRFAWILAGRNLPRELSVLHRCDNRACVNVDHLFLGTHQDNMADMVRKGRSLSGDRSPIRKHGATYRGERHHNARLTHADAQAIRSRLAAGESRPPIARDYGVSTQAVARIANNVTWRTQEPSERPHVTAPS